MSGVTPGKMIIGFAAIAVVAAIVTAVMLEPPHAQREFRLDEHRTNDLAALDAAIGEYWKRKSALPSHLEALSSELGSRATRSDPETNQPYRYEVTGSTSFRLCATFARESRDTARYGYDARQFQWGHKAGSQCFDLEVRKENSPAPPIAR